MKKLSLYILLLITVGNYSCERDDLCPESTQTTASLVIETFDVSLQDETKIVVALRIEGIDDEGNSNGALEDFNAVNTSTIVLPLRTDTNVTRFKLIQDYEINDNGTPDDTSDDFGVGDEDTITITYIPEDVFVSRACGYKTVFNNVQISFDEDIADRWIQQIRAENDNQIVENEAAAHFSLFH